MREVVPRALDGQRLDRVVAMVAGCSRAEAAALVDAGAVAVAGRPVTSRSQRVADGDVLEVDLPAPAGEGGLVADPAVELAVVHEDADLVVVDKPAGLVVHPGAGQAAGTLVHGLLARYPEIRGVGQADRPGIVHRLDKGTSGLLLVARSPAAYEALVAMLGARAVDRRYHTLVWGVPDAPTGMVDAPIGRSGRDRTRMAVTVRGREARTGYEVRRAYREPVEVAELTCTLETGRTHQIRAHFAAIGHPLAGDATYGGPVRYGLQRQFLHAHRLVFDHPLSGERLDLSAPLPPDLERALELARTIRRS